MTASSKLQSIPAGSAVRVRAGASSANLGPGFDSLGLALDWADEVEIEVQSGPITVEVSGEGAESVPRDERHLVVSALLGGLVDLRAQAPGLRLRAHNTIPHGRGLGSSSAALVTGLAAAWSLARPEQELDRDWLLQRAHALEGHADNVAATIFGGLVLTWSDGVGTGRAQVAKGSVAPGIGALAVVPTTVVLTEHARAVLPAQVPHAEAAANAGRAALLVHALAGDPTLLLPATREWLHQDYRADLMPASHALIVELRAAGLAAFVSGAGPTVLVLGGSADLERAAALVAEQVGESEVAVHRLGIGAGVGVEQLG